MSRYVKLLCAADDLGTIADAVAELITLLDRFYTTHDEDITDRLDLAWPENANLGPHLVKELRRLEDQFIPQEDE